MERNIIKTIIYYGIFIILFSVGQTYADEVNANFEYLDDAI